MVCSKGLCHDFVSKFFCLTVPKILRRGTLRCFRKTSGGEKDYEREGRGVKGREGKSRISVENILSHSAEEFLTKVL